MFASRRIRWIAALVMAMLSAASFSENTRIKFQLDWRFEGPAALFLVAKSKGYFTQEKLDVTIDAGNGSGNAINRLASGAYDMGFADMAPQKWPRNAIAWPMKNSKRAA